MTRALFVEAGERGRLLPKELTYVFSFDFELRLESPAPKPPGPLVLLDPSNREIFHVTDRKHVTTADGATHEVPKAKLKRAQDFLPATGGVAAIGGRLLFETDTKKPLVMNYSGILNVPCGTSRFCDRDASHKAATAFVHSRQDFMGAKYRWLVWNQLIGVGEVRAIRRGAKLDFAFAYDFYVAS